MQEALYSTNEIALALGLGRRAVAKRASLGRVSRDGQILEQPWRIHSTQKRNGGTVNLFSVNDLPREIVAALFRSTTPKLSQSLSSDIPPQKNLTQSVKPLAHAPQVTEHARAIRDARQAVRAAILRLQEQAGCSLKRAVVTFLTQAQAGRLEASVASAVLSMARDGRGRKGAVQAAGFPSERSLYRWLATEDLAPKKPQPDMQAKPWMWVAAELFARPQKPTLKWVHEQLKTNWNPTWGNLVSYDTLARFFREKYSKLDALKGRHHGSRLRSHLRYQHRTADGLEPFVEVHADGWTTHFTAPHPVTGEFVTYEVWHFHDLATRYVTPPAIGQSESSEVILKGLENCIRFGGVPAVWQTDSTGSVKNKKVQFDPISSLSTRAGISIVHPQEIGNSQANGICENYNTYLDRESRELATYQGAGMDSLIHKRVKKLTEKMVKAARDGNLTERDLLKRQAQAQGKGIVFGTFEEAVAWINSKVEKSNNTPHSSLPKIKDPASGRMVHMTPQQALDAAKDAGWAPISLDETSLIDLFRPHIRKTVTRETVSPYNGQRYYHPVLSDFNGEEVMVAIDTMDGSRVWVKDLQGRFLCEASFLEATGYRQLSYYEHALEKRASAQIRRKEQQIEQIERRMAAPALEMEASGQVLPFSMASHPALRATASEARPIATASDQHSDSKADFSDLAMQLYGEEIDAQDRDAEKTRDSRLQEIDETVSGSTEDRDKRVAGD